MKIKNLFLQIRKSPRVRLWGVVTVLGLMLALPVMIALLPLGVVILGALTFIFPPEDHLADDHPEGQSFFIREDHEEGNGRNLELYWPVGTPSTFPTTYLDYSFHNLWCRDAKGLHTSTADTKSNPELYPMRPLPVHRPSGRIDTLCYTNYNVTPSDKVVLYDPPAGTGPIPIGYIHRMREIKHLIVMETKLPGEILGHMYLSIEENQKEDSLAYSLSDYTYEGQEKVFESEMSHYWIANKRTTDLYGPMTEKELALTLERSGIRLPLKLKNPYDRYVYPKQREINLNDYPDSVRDSVIASLPPFPHPPKRFSWPHWNVRKKKVIRHMR
ncbi:MAG: hypothetical protein K5945_08500 [Bacteroidaceae bacterium]|nr:hypothetical protein [Bacteroidaceae bacterium]